MKKIYRERVKTWRTKRVTARVRNTLVLPVCARTVARSLQHIEAIFSVLFADEDFVTLLEAQSTDIPAYFGPLLDQARNKYEIG
jgi:hypothetical protein